MIYVRLRGERLKPARVGGNSDRRRSAHASRERIGKWTLVVDGRDTDVDRCRPVWQHLAANIFHIGPAACGNQVQLLNQLMFGAIDAMTAEMMAIAEHIGLPPALLYHQ